MSNWSGCDVCGHRFCYEDVFINSSPFVCGEDSACCHCEDGLCRECEHEFCGKETTIKKYNGEEEVKECGKNDFCCNKCFEEDECSSVSEDEEDKEKAQEKEEEKEN